MGGGVLSALKFIGAIFVGTSSTSAAYVFAVNVARVGVLALGAKVFAPKIDLSRKAIDKQITIRDPLSPQAIVYGEDLISGPVIFTNVDGTDLHIVIALAGHEIDSVTGYRLDDEDIVLGQLSGAEDGDVTSGKYADVASVQLFKGTDTQSASSVLTTAYPTLFKSAHRGRGWAYMVWTFTLVEGKEDVFDGGPPRNIRAQVRGRKLFDPRKYAINADPGFKTVGKYGLNHSSLKWFGNTSATQEFGYLSDSVTIGLGDPVVLSLEDNDNSLEQTWSEAIPVDASETYTVRQEVQQPSGDRNQYLAVSFYDSGGANITASGSGATGWLSLGTYFYHNVANANFPSTWTTYTFQFGATGASIPAGAVTMRIGALSNGPGSNSTRVDYRNWSLYRGTIRHDPDDASTWEWSECGPLALADWYTDQKFGMREDFDRVDWPKVIAAADIADTGVSAPSPPTQNRYTCNATFLADETRGAVKDELLSSFVGRHVFSQGKWRMWAGAPIAADVTLTESNLRGGVTLQASSPSLERYNRVRGKFVDAGRNYQGMPYPERRNAAYVTEDAGEVHELVADFTSCTNIYEAQRKAEFKLRQSRMQRVLVFEGNLSCFRIQPGTTVLLDIAEYGFNGEKFFVSQWAFTEEGGIDLTLVQEDDSVWTDLASPADYSTRTPTGTLTFAETGVLPPTGATVATIVGGTVLAWTNPNQQTFEHVEIWVSDDNDRANAELVGTSQGERFIDIGSDISRTRYYWLRAVDEFGRVSEWLPNLTTTTLTALPQIGQLPLVADPFIRLGTAFWDETPDASYQVGAGLNGTDAIRMQQDSVVRSFLAAERRGPREWDALASGRIAIEIRWRWALQNDPGGVYTMSAFALVEVADENGANATTYVKAGDTAFSNGDATGAWKDDSAIIEIDDNGTPPRFIRVGIQLGVNLLGPTFDFDFLEATVNGKAFGGAGTLGLVPDPVTEDGTFLKDDGTFAAPAKLVEASQDSVVAQSRNATGNTSGATVLDHAGTALDVGFNVMADFNWNTSDTMEARHVGHITGHNDTVRTADMTLTLPADDVFDWPVDGVCHVMNGDDTYDVVVNEGTGVTLYYLEPGTGLVDTTGGITIGPGGFADIRRESDSVFHCWGSEITYTP